MDLNAVPVLMYHSVKYKRKDSWIHRHLSLTIDEFERHLNFFRMLRIKTYFLDDIYLHLKGEKKLNNRSITLTFDDGYTDNWVFVYPLLEKYNLKGTIFVNPDFVDNSDRKVRPTLKDYWEGKVSLDELNNYDGFLNWEEMRLLEKSGVMEIQSHTMTHTKYPVSDEIIDFVNPNTRIDWLHWNLFPDDKPYFLTNPRNKIPLGYPIYKSEKGNIARKYQEDGSITEAAIKFVADKGGENFFNNSNWKEELFTVTKAIQENKSNVYKKESDEEYRDRLIYELKESKRILSKNLGKEINHVCWPFGGWSEKTVDMAIKLGYHTSTAKGDKNIFGKEKFHNIDRIALDNPKYQNSLFFLYALYKYFSYKI